METTVPVMEQKLARRPHSPLFARLADAYRKDGNVAAAKELLLAGLVKYPSYPAARIVLARCLAEEGSYTEALAELRRASEAIPESVRLSELELEWEALAAPPAPVVVASEPAELPEAPPALLPVGEQPPVESTPAGVDVPAGRTELPAAPPSADERVLPPAPPPAPVAMRRSAAQRRIEDSRIVSKTLAEIYAMQGEYGEAIITYTMLKQQRPERAPEYDLRIAELEQALQAKLNQQKLAVTK